MSHTEKPLFPDTLSFEDRVALAIHSLIGIINPDNGYLPLMHADLTAPDACPGGIDRLVHADRGTKDQRNCPSG